MDAVVREYADNSEDMLRVYPSPGTFSLTREVHERGHRICQLAASFDMQVETAHGQQGWTNLCAAHACEHGLSKQGMGRGQYLLHPDEIFDRPGTRMRASMSGVDINALLAETEEEWSRTYRMLGFVRANREVLVRAAAGVDAEEEVTAAGGPDGRHRSYWRRRERRLPRGSSGDAGTPAPRCRYTTERDRPSRGCGGRISLARWRQRSPRGETTDRCGRPPRPHDGNGPSARARLPRNGFQRVQAPFDERRT